MLISVRLFSETAPNGSVTKDNLDLMLWVKEKKKGERCGRGRGRGLKQLKKLKAHCEDHNFTHAYPQFTYMIFIYSYSHIFTIIGYMTNSQLTIYPCGLIAQWIERA